MVIGTAYAAILLLLTLGPLGWWLNRLTVRVYGWWRYDLGNIDSALLPEHVGIGLNVVLFVPVGVVVAALLRRPWWVSGLVAAILSAGIELIQLLPALSREASVSDVVANATGGVLGAALLTLAERLLHRRRAGS